jgi:hypothetical protein
MTKLLSTIEYLLPAFTGVVATGGSVEWLPVLYS